MDASDEEPLPKKHCPNQQPVMLLFHGKPNSFALYKEPNPAALHQENETKPNWTAVLQENDTELFGPFKQLFAPYKEKSEKLQREA